MTDLERKQKQEIADLRTKLKKTEDEMHRARQSKMTLMLNSEVLQILCAKEPQFEVWVKQQVLTEVTNRTVNAKKFDMVDELNREGKKIKKLIIEEISRWGFSTKGGNWNDKGELTIEKVTPSVSKKMGELVGEELNKIAIEKLTEYVDEMINTKIDQTIRTIAADSVENVDWNQLAKECMLTIAEERFGGKSG